MHSSPGQRGPLRVLLADDDAPFRRAMRSIIGRQTDMRVVAETSDGTETICRVRALRPAGLDLVLLDISMPGLDGIQTARALTASDASLPVVMVTISVLDRDLFEAIRAGAIGYLSKGLSAEAIVRALRGFHHEESLPLSRSMANKVLTYFGAHERPAAPRDLLGEGLSKREHEVLELVAQGAHDREIAARLNLAEGTVKKHIQNILRKLHARNRAEAAASLGRWA
jgi:DNA-binding NarL/FixJ family response regulator